ncbi:hypothetical protein Kisp01_46010 [Kineosporia sp. NBRC 101677]|uniref:GAP family protein n=1 Tax=Kineosporia sp. NBRC 101677 TaxID=3032197 RepID=UPI0024A141AD|nr:GAP family protein [Kineosporia sp. NBRC 101677]GLY17587.1 hypothetical protein Kisp01_46010 [Kineosporia sp. NBRC 101677]
MNPALLGEILPLALLDSVSVSTLLVPVWFLLAPGDLRYRNVFGYLLVLAVGYLALRVGLAAGFSALRRQVANFLDSPVGDLLVTVLGVALLLFAAWYGLLRRPDQVGDEGRLSRWRDAVVGSNAAARRVVVVGVVAVLLEAAMMIPYLIAIDTLDRAETGTVATALLLAVYCLVMVLPAAVLTVGRMTMGGLLAPVLHRINSWIRRNEREDTAWLLAIVGGLLLSTTDLFARLSDSVGG